MQGDSISSSTRNSKYRYFSEIVGQKDVAWRSSGKVPKATFLTVFNCSLIVTSLLLIQLCSVQCFSFFRDADNQVRSQLKNDRPCNFLLGSKDTHLSAPEIIRKYGYPVERHWVTTEDGYVLELHRIPARNNYAQANHKISQQVAPKGARIEGNNITNSKPSPAVFLMHGIVGSSRDFVINCDRRALPFELWEKGYDVWLGNYRGNPYGLNHTFLKPQSSAFWDFAIHEVGYYDMPAMIDYVLNTTKLKEVSIVAHSMGNGVTLIMLSTRPEYCSKVSIWFAMAGAVTLQNTGSPILRISAAFPRTTEWFLTKFNHGELYPKFLLSFINRVVSFLCKWEGRREGSYHGFCSTSNFLLDGYDPGQIPPKLYSTIVAGMPTSTSVRFFVQWMQWIISGNLTMYDFGPLKNLRKYGSVKPAKYPIESVQIKAVIMYGENDWFVSALDVAKMQELTRRIYRGHDDIEYFKIEPPTWNHLDFMYGKDADIYVYSHILKKLEKVYQNLS